MALALGVEVGMRNSVHDDSTQRLYIGPGVPPSPVGSSVWVLPFLLSPCPVSA